MSFQNEVILPVIKLAAVLTFFVATLSLHSCTEESNDICYSFDERQCASDPWKVAEPDRLNDSLDDFISSYFLTNDIELKSLSIDEAFHEVNCLACDVCPTSTRIYISVSQLDKQKVEVLDLLSLAEIDCEGL